MLSFIGKSTLHSFLHRTRVAEFEGIDLTREGYTVLQFVGPICKIHLQILVRRYLAESGKNSIADLISRQIVYQSRLFKSVFLLYLWLFHQKQVEEQQKAWGSSHHLVIFVYPKGLEFIHFGTFVQTSLLSGIYCTTGPLPAHTFLGEEGIPKKKTIHHHPKESTKVILGLFVGIYSTDWSDKMNVYIYIYIIYIYIQGFFISSIFACHSIVVN